MSFVKIISTCGVLGIIAVCLLSSSAWSQPSDSTVTAIPGAIPYLYGWFTLNPEAEEKVPLLEQIDGGQVMIVSLYFAPPGDLRFVPFPNEPTRLVDIATQNLSGFSAQPLIETASTIQVYAAFDESALPSADEYPLQAEGNLSGGEGEGESPHWNAQTGLLDLAIYNGQDATVAVPEEKEETVGAFSVANLNNTDSDNTADNQDDSIPGEKDMIKLEIKKSSPNMTGNVTLTITGDGTQVKLWKAETKAGGVEAKRTWSATELPVTVWVEGLAKSTAVRDIEAAIKYNGNVVDKAKMTFVWATQTAVEHNRQTSAQLLAAAAWANMTIPPKDFFSGQPPLVDGTGLLPINATVGVANCIVFKYKLEPTGLWDEGVRWDITRQKEGKIWQGTIGQGGQITWETVVNNAWPGSDDAANDDAKTIDESTSPNADHEMFGMDYPGYPSDTGQFDVGLMRENFYEYVRVRFDGVRPSGNGTNGSRCSSKYEWHVRHRFTKNVQGKFQRDSGDAPESNTNDIGPSHITIGNPS